MTMYELSEVFGRMMMDYKPDELVDYRVEISIKDYDGVELIGQIAAAYIDDNAKRIKLCVLPNDDNTTPTSRIQVSLN